jgi:hypothetical protein
MTLREKRETLFALIFSATAHGSFAKSLPLQLEIDPGNTAGFSSFFLGGKKIRHYSEELLFF